MRRIESVTSQSVGVRQRQAGNDERGHSETNNGARFQPGRAHSERPHADRHSYQHTLNGTGKKKGPQGQAGNYGPQSTTVSAFFFYSE